MAKSNVIDFIFQVISRIYIGSVSGKIGQSLNGIVFDLSLRGLGFNNCCDMKTTGEAWFVNQLAQTKPLLCVDIGANVGDYSRSLLSSTSATVFAFEPLPGAFSELETLLNDFPERFRPFELAISNTAGDADLYFGDPKSGLASLSKEVNQIEYVGDSNTSSVRVRAEKLDHYFDSFMGVAQEIDFMKIDVEGFEWEVLDGAKETLVRMRPKFVQLESNHHQLFRGHSLLSLSHFFPGYKVFQLLPYQGGLVLRDCKEPIANIFHFSNFIFIRGDVDFPMGK